MVLCGALLHALWNLLIKSHRDTHLATAGLYVAAGVIAAAVLPFVGLPARASWPYLAASTVAELMYGMLLAAVYRVGDLSYAYPLMRGAAPLLVALGSGALIGERLSGAMWAGVLVVSGGILSMLREGRSTASQRSTRLALLNAVAIATYTTIDGLGVRRSGRAVSYSLALFVLMGIPWLGWALVRYRADRWAELRAHVPLSLIGGVCSIGSYAIALWAMTRAPVAAVAAARESSIVFGTLLGALVLHERVTLTRGVAAAAITVGVWTIRAA